MRWIGWIGGAALAVLALGLEGRVRAQSALDDPLARMQAEAVATRDEPRPRAYHFGAQGPGGVFSTHTSHSNRLVPAYFLGSTVDLEPYVGPNSAYRDPSRLQAIYGRVPEHTVNPSAEYLDQSDLYRIQAEAVRRGARFLFTVWFDGMDWEVVRAAVLARTGREPSTGPGAGPFFENFAGTRVQFAAVVTSPSRVDPPAALLDVDRQTLGDLSGLLGGGYDPRFGGFMPWEPGPLLARAPLYLMGQSAGDAGRRQVEAAGGAVHAYTDSAPSAAAYASGVKQSNGVINFDDQGRVVETLYNQLQAQGWRVGTVTSVPFPHASPAAMYAHNVSRDDYQDLAREMLGLPSIVQQTGRGPARPGLDVVIGSGRGIRARDRDREAQGANLLPGDVYLADADRAAIDVRNGGSYVVAERTPGRRGGEVLAAAAAAAARDGRRLFGYFGTAAGHLPYRTASGDYRPVKGIRGYAERYSPADLRENPTLAEMTSAALTVLAAEPRRPFALFVEPGDVDFALHDNNLDNAVGAMVSGEEALRVLFDWVERHSDWNESVLIVTADHGHYLVIDDPAALAGSARLPDTPPRAIGRDGRP
jgi:alkaline phosphatase